MYTFRYYFNTAFPLKTTQVNNSVLNTWITKAIIVSRNKLRILCHIKKSTEIFKVHSELSTDLLKSDIRGKKREAYKIISSATNKSKTLWKIINKEIGNSQQAPNIIINSQVKIITNPQMITEKFNSYFTDIIEDLLSQVNSHCPKQNLKFQTKESPKSMFIAPVTEAEVIQVIKDLKNNSSLGVDETPTFLVKQCLCHLIQPLVHIYNISFQTGTFPDMLKKARVKPLYK